MQAARWKKLGLGEGPSGTEGRVFSYQPNPKSYEESKAVSMADLGFNYLAGFHL